MNKFMQTIMFLCLTAICAKAQEPEKVITVNKQITGTKDYVARDLVILEPGFQYEAAGSDKLTVKTDPNLICNANYHDPTTVNTLLARKLDKSKPVGSIPGTAGANATGGASYNIPLDIPEGFANMTPQLSIAYNSQAGNNHLGKGWGIAGMEAIARVGQDFYHDGKSTGIQYSDQDRLVMNGNRLNAMKNNYWATNERYDLESDLSVQVQSYGSGSTLYFIAEAKNGIRMEFGRTRDSRTTLTGKNLPYIWRLNKVTDINGNYIQYIYGNKGGQSWIKEILYTGTSSASPNNSIKFYYSKPQKNPLLYVNGSSVRPNKILREINVARNGNNVSSYSLHYKKDGLDNNQLVEIELKDRFGNKFNSTVIEWGNMLNGGLSSSEKYLATGESSTVKKFLTGDFNGDGKQDILVALKDFKAKYFKKWQLHIATSGGYRKVQEGNLTRDFRCFYTGDFDNDGIDDIMKRVWEKHTVREEVACSDEEAFPPGEEGSLLAAGQAVPRIAPPWEENRKCYRTYSYYRTNLQFYSFNGTRLIRNKSKDIEYSGKPYSDIENMLLLPDDYNGDGKTDWLSLLNNQNFYGLRGAGSYEDIDFENPDVVRPLKFNDNNKTDILVVKGFRLRVYEYQDSQLVLIREQSIAGLNANDLQFGDFNGDGKTDIVTYSNSESKIVAYGSTGVKFEKLNIVFPSIIKGVHFDYTDINGDGLKDILGTGSSHGKANYLFYLNNGTGFTIKKTSRHKSNWRGYYRLGEDFDGDGSVDFQNNNYYSLSYFGSRSELGGIAYRIQSFNLDNDYTLVKSIKNGKNFKHSFHYLPSSNNQVYQSDHTGLSYHVAHMGATDHLLRSITYSNGIGGSTTETYQYKNGRVHTQGKGFLGFLSRTVTNSGSGITTQTTQTLNTAYYVLVPEKTKVSKEDASLSVSSQSIHLVSRGSKKYYAKMNWQKEENKLTGITKTTTFNAYDAHGNPTKVTTEFLNSDVKEEKSFEYVTKNAWCPNKPSKVTTKKYKGAEFQTRTVNYLYDNKGNITKKTLDEGDQNALVTEYLGYNNHGSPQTVKVTANGKSRSTSFKYSPSGRLLKEKKDGATGFVIKYAYDTTTGLTISEESHLGKTYYEYDGFGRLVKTAHPDGTNTVNSLHWKTKDGPTRAVYYSYAQTSGLSPQWTWYDELGRQVRKEYYGFDTNKKICVDTDYNKIGQVGTVSKPYYSGGTKETETTYVYDSYGRVESETSPMGSTTYDYSKKQETKITSPSGVTIKTTNSAGQLVTSTVNGRSVSYTYWPSGQVKTSTPQDGSAVETYFDLQGNRTKLVDPDAGTVNSKYNGFGELVWEEHTKTKADGTPETIKTSITYDGMGRVSKATVNGVVTAHKYHEGTGFLEWTKKPGHEVYYKYDEGSSKKRGLITTYTEKIGNRTFVSKSSYDLYGRETKHTYPSGYYTTSSYNKYGHLTEVKSKGDKSVWKALATNIKGQFTLVKKGNRTTTYGYEPKKFLPTSINCPGVIEHRYKFYSDGNLQHRKDLITKQKEVFTYTANKQLAGWEIFKKGTSVATFDMRYDNHGNITGKTDIGYEMVYKDPVRKHALTGIKGNPALVADDMQDITYTDFLKVETISEGNHNLRLSYGVDNQRRKAEYRTNGSLTKTRYYLGSYEEDIVVGGNHRKIHYISGADGLAGIYIETGGTGKLYHAYTDYLGSLTTLTDEAGSVIERHAFDPWGNRRNVNNWKDKITALPSYLTDRGFTLHEHLDDFALINMNGRVYDPLVASFLSPDPQLQAPGNWLNYNRYAYGYNNPMMFTDPTGEWLWIPLMFVGAYVGGVSSNGGELNPWSWSWNTETFLGVFMGAAVGAMTGYGIMNPGSVEFIFGVNSPWASVSFGVGAASYGAGEGTDWKYKFSWTTAAGGGGEISNTDHNKPANNAIDQINFERRVEYEHRMDYSSGGSLGGSFVDGFVGGAEATWGFIKSQFTWEGYLETQANIFTLGMYGSAKTAVGLTNLASNIPEYTANDYAYGAGFATEKALELLLLRKVSGEFQSIGGGFRMPRFNLRIQSHTHSINPISGRGISGSKPISHFNINKFHIIYNPKNWSGWSNNPYLPFRYKN